MREKVFVVVKNADDCEGRGPMVIDSVFSEKKQAMDYIDEQPGVQGRRFKWSQEPHGDWQVWEWEVMDDAKKLIKIREEEERKRALARISDRDRKLLGL